MWSVFFSSTIQLMIHLWLCCGMIFLKYISYPWFNIFFIYIFQWVIKRLYCSFYLTIHCWIIWSWGEMFYAIIGHKFFQIWTCDAGGIICLTLVRLARFCNFPVVVFEITVFIGCIYNNQEHFLFTGPA